MEERFYWPHWAKLNTDRSLTIKTTGYDQDQTHWIDHITVAPADADYEFWLWLSENRQDLVTGHDLEVLRQDFNARASKHQAPLALKQG